MSHRSIIVLPDDTGKADPRRHRRREEIAAHQDVRLLRPGSDRRRHRRQRPRASKSGSCSIPRAAAAKTRTRRRARRSRKPASRSTTATPTFGITHEKSHGRRRRNGVREVAQLGDEEPHRDARLRDRHLAQARGRRDHRLLRSRLAPQEVRPGRARAPHLVPRQRPRAHRPLHRRRQAHALRAERALPGLRHHRAPGARRASRREGPRHGAPAAFA